jgi:predicted TIM-barrel fold metal-dependent hydrolase
MEYYDVHTHVGLDQSFLLRGWWPYASTSADLLEKMDANGIAKAVCFPFGVPSAFDPYAFADDDQIKLLPGRVPFDRENIALLNEVDRIDKDGRLHVLAMFDPSRQVATQVKNLEPLVGRMTGLKLQGTLLQSPVTDLLTGGRPLMDFADQHNLPVLIHTAICANDVWAQPADCLKVAEAFPRVRFNLAHSHRFHEPTLREAAARQNVWVDCSAHIVHCRGALQDAAHVAKPTERVKANYADPTDVLAAVYDLIGDTYLWGTDNPYHSWCDDTMAELCSYKAEADAFHALPDATKRSMGHDAPRAWLFGE